MSLTIKDVNFNNKRCLTFPEINFFKLFFTITNITNGAIKQTSYLRIKTQYVTCYHLPEKQKIAS